MLNKQKILELAQNKGRIITNDVVVSFGVSRQYANLLINSLVLEQKMVKVGSTKSSFYVLPEYLEKNKDILPNKFIKVYKNENLEEHKVLEEIEYKSLFLRSLSENIRSIFTYAFSEMLNNAIEHSGTKSIRVGITLYNGKLSFVIEDRGVGVFRSVMNKKKLKSEFDAIGELIKGKITTMPKSHSGEGIFFTSRAGDDFVLDSFGHQLIFKNKIPDVFINQSKKTKKGTKVVFEIDVSSDKHLNDIFKEYANLSGQGDYGFDKTEIRVKLYVVGGIHISRSQARRILSGLEKFKIILFDYENVAMVGQAFADEIYRVFQKKNPQIKIEEINMNEGVEFMIKRVKNEAKN